MLLHLPPNMLQVRTTNYTTTKTSVKFLIHSGAKFIGTRSPTHQHSDYIVLAGGSVECTATRPLGDFARIWLQKGATADLHSCRPGSHTRLYYEDGAKIVWPNNDKSKTDGCVFVFSVFVFPFLCVL